VGRGLAATDLGDRGRPRAGTAAGWQLIAAGEHVWDVPPKLAARVRLLDTGQINNNDDNDARSDAVAALRARDLPELVAEDQTMVMRVWPRRCHDRGRLRTQAVCRVHAVLRELVPAELASTCERARRSSSSTASSPIPLPRRRHSSSPAN
jgi:hypothetical protein